MVTGIIVHMARCTAPVRGHRSASAAADCPACGSRYGRYSGYSSYGSYSSPSYSSLGNSGGGRSSGGGSGSSARPRWSPASSSVAYTPAEVRALTPVRESVEKRAPLPDLRDVFLCHAWDDRSGAAKELHDLLESRGIKVWFSEKDVVLGTPLLREIDKGLAKSRVGIVLVTPALLRRLQAEGIADKELSALLARDLLVPIVHDTTYEALREVSPPARLAKRSEHRRSTDGRRRGQARRVGRHPVTINALVGSGLIEHVILFWISKAIFELISKLPVEKVVSVSEYCRVHMPGASKVAGSVF